MVLSNYERAGVMLCELICNSLGLLGTVLILVLYLGYPKMRIPAFQMVFWLTLSTAGYSIGVLIGPSNNTKTCSFQATFLSYFSLSSLLWLSMMTHSIQQTVLNSKSPEEYMKRYILIGYLAPIPTTIIPGLIGSYSRTPLGMCWIDTSSGGGVALLLFQVFLLLPLIFAYSAWVLCKIHRNISELRSDNESASSRLKHFNRLKYFSAIVFVSWTFAFIDMLALMTSPSEPSFALIILHLIFSGLQGLFCLGAFVMDHVVYEALIDTFSTCMPCLIKRSKAKRKLELNSRV